MNRELLEQQLSALPLFCYEFISPEELTFSERVREICRTECPRYGKTWSCPPAVGTVRECRERCLSFSEVLVLVTVAEVEDVENLELTLRSRMDHEAVTHQVEQWLRDQGCRIMTLSTEACALCAHCTYPDKPCCHPEHMLPCVESHGILVTELSEKLGLEFFNGNIVTWYALIFCS